MSDITLRFLLGVLLMLAIKGGVALAGHSIAWVWAALIALVLVWGGWLAISGDIID